MLAIALMPACAGSIDDPTRFTNGQGPLGDGGSSTCDPARLVATRCAKSGCHDAKTKFFGLDLESPGVAGRIIDQKSTCQDKLLVDSVNIEASYLVEKLGSNPGCGTRMPSAGAEEAFNAGQRACFIEWIKQLVGGGADTGGGGGDAGGAAGDGAASSDGGRS